MYKKQFLSLLLIVGFQFGFTHSCLYVFCEIQHYASDVVDKWCKHMPYQWWNTILYSKLNKELIPVLKMWILARSYHWFSYNILIQPESQKCWYRIPFLRARLKLIKIHVLILIQLMSQQIQVIFEWKKEEKKYVLRCDPNTGRLTSPKSNSSGHQNNPQFLKYETKW